MRRLQVLEQENAWLRAQLGLQHGILHASPIAQDAMEALLAAVPAPCWLLEFDAAPGGARLYANPVALALQCCALNPEGHYAPAGSDVPGFRMLQDGVELRSTETPLHQAARDGRATPPSVLEIRRADGTATWVYGSAAPLFDASGRLSRCLAAYVDITSLRRAEMEGRRLRDELGLALQAAELCMWRVDEQRRLSWNSIGDRLFGGAAGQLGYDTERWLGQVVPADRERVRLHAQSLQQGAPPTPVQFWFRRLDNGELRLLESIGQLQDDSGVRRQFGLLRDITSVQQAAAENQRLSETLRLAIKAAELGIWEFDPATRRLDWDEASTLMFGCRPADCGFDTRQWQEHVVVEDRERVARGVEAMVSEGQIEHVVFRFRRPSDGQLRWIESSGLVLRSEHGSQVRQVGVSRDVTARAQLLEDLHRSNTLLSTTESVAKVGGWELDLDTGRMFWTDETYRIHELDPAQFQPSLEGALACYLPDSQLQIRNAATRAASEGVGADLQLCLRTPSGRLVDVRLTAVVEHAEGRYRRAHGSIQDISESKRAAAELQRTQAHLQNLVDGTDAVIWEQEADSDELSFISANAERLFGYPANAWRDPVFRRSLVHPEDLPVVARFRNELAQGAGNCRAQFRLLTAQGKWLWMDNSIRKVERPGAAPILRGVAIDVTEERQSAAREAARSRILLMIAGGSPLPEILKAIVLHVEDALTPLRSSILTYSPLTKSLHVGAMPNLPESLVELCEGMPVKLGYGVCSSACALGRRVICVDVLESPECASMRDLALQAGVRACWSEPIRASTGEILGTFATYASQPHQPSAAEHAVIADANSLAAIAIGRHLSQAQQLQAQRRQFLIFDAVAEALVVQDAHGSITDCNSAAERIFRKPVAAIVGSSWADHSLLWVDGEGQSLSAERMPWLLSLRSRVAQRGVVIGLKREGEGMSWWSVNTSLTEDPVGGQTMVVSCLADITRSRLLEQELSRQNQLLERRSQEAQALARAKSDFLANMSHEMRTPLTAIVGYSDEALRQPEDSANLRKSVATIRRSADHLLALVNDVLDAAQLDSGQLRLHQTLVDPEQLCRDVIEILRNSAEAKGLRISFDATSKLPSRIRVDDLRLKQVLWNLVSNAIKFTEQGEVRIDASMGEGEMLIRVTDSGIGIMRQQMATLFQPFAQADATRSRRYGGSGLGLYISRALIERMGGSIHVSSEMGRGSCFSVRLPIDERGPAAPDEPAASTILPPRRQSFAGVRVLVAEDDDILQELMRAMLGELGITADVVSNGRQAIERMQAASYDLVLMDMHMPELDGREATRRLRAAGIAIPIVALTADLVPESIDEHRAAGCDCVLAKPLTRDQLASTLEQCLADSAGAVSRERG